ncbi:hypothetical protein, partial [Xanthomonas vasicola]|uniref:hypothetical protein n=1 Tax=Xanthomonas vasicola TaxID=56459 RepID=UPI001D0C3400
MIYQNVNGRTRACDVRSDSCQYPFEVNVASISHPFFQFPQELGSRFGAEYKLSKVRDGLINATGKRSNRIRRAEGAQIADFLPVSARLRGVAWITGT